MPEKNETIELRKFVAPEFIFGSDALTLAGRYARNFGARHVLLVSDHGVVATGWTEKVMESLKEAEISWTLFSNIVPNPTIGSVMKGAHLFLENNCDAIVAVGDGSPMDCAKGIGIIASNGGHITDYQGVDKIPVPIPPLICVPTTGGSSADVSQFAIINNEAKKVKFAIISKTMVPDVSLIDPSVLTTMDDQLTANTGIDALVHAFEAYVSNASWAVTDMNAREAVALISANLKKCIEDPHNIKYRAAIMRASLQAGLAFSNASLGAVHAMAHSLGGLLDLPHGECNAILLPHIVAYNFDFASEKYLQLATMMGIDLNGLNKDEQKKQCISQLKQFLKDVGVSTSLSSLGVQPKDIEQLAKNSLADPCMLTNPRVPTQQEIEQLFRDA